MDPILNPGVLMARDFSIIPHQWNFFDSIFNRIQQAEAEMEAMRNQMFRLLPQDLFDVQKNEIQPKGRMIVEEKGETKLKLEFDVHEFKPEEVKVKVLGNNILQVSADHEEKTDQGYQRRNFVRQYSLPAGVESDKLRPTLTKDGVLTIEGPAPALKASERMVPIEYNDEKEKEK